MSFGGTLAWSGAECFTMCCLGPPATNPKPNTLGQWHTGDTAETPMDSLPGLLPEAPFSMGRAESFPPCRKTWCWRGGQRQAQLHPRRCRNAHGNSTCWRQGTGTHMCMDTDTTAPGPEEQLVPLSVIPPLWLARGGTFPCHKHPGRASPSASAHAARPRLLRCCCWLLQHLPQTSQQFQPRVIFPDQTHPTVQLPPRPSGKH